MKHLSKNYKGGAQFKDLSIGQHFDWVDPKNPAFNSFYKRCRKISARKYMDSDGQTHQVGSTCAYVFHVEDL